MMDSLEIIASFDVEFSLYSKLNDSVRIMSNQDEGQSLLSHF